jgi:hypothetical protein
VAGIFIVPAKKAQDVRWEEVHTRSKKIVSGVAPAGTTTSAIWQKFFTT